MRLALSAKVLALCFCAPFLVACGDEASANLDAGAKDTGKSPDLDAGSPGSDAEDGASPDLEPADQGDPDLVRIDLGASDADLTDTGPEDGQMVIDDGPAGFIGGPCTADSDCMFMGGACLTEGFSRGACSLPCDDLCPDQMGAPVTFCVATAGLPPGAGRLAPGGACLSRCDFGLFPAGGCRPDYGCVTEPRFMDAATERAVCLPGRASEVSACLMELALMGVDFEPTVIPDTSPAGEPGLVCHVEDPVIIHPPLHGVDLVYYDGTATPNIRAACSMAKALALTVDDVKAQGVVKLMHFGTYNCRIIAGTNRLSRHGLGDAIDIYGFELANGSVHTLVDDWEHDTTMPQSDGARFLYDAAHRWHDMMFWSIILTPNYNAAHDNHFHVDLTPGSDFLQIVRWPYLGPAPYGD